MAYLRKQVLNQKTANNVDWDNVERNPGSLAVEAPRSMLVQGDTVKVTIRKKNLSGVPKNFKLGGTQTLTDFRLREGASFSGKLNGQLCVFSPKGRNDISVEKA